MISTVKVVRVKLVCDTCRVSSTLRPTPRSLYDALGAEGWHVLSDARAKCLASHCPRCTQARDLTPGHVVYLIPRTSHANAPAPTPTARPRGPRRPRAEASPSEPAAELVTEPTAQEGTP